MILLTGQPQKSRSSGGQAHPGAPIRETIDRVVASTDSVAITQSDVENEYGMETLLEEGRVPSTSFGSADFDRVRDRLIDQKLLEKEAETEEIDSAGLREAAQQRLAEVRLKFPSAGAFQSALRSLGMSEGQLMERLVQQERILRLIDVRLRPAATVEDDEIAAYYRESFVPEYARHKEAPAPPLASVASQIRDILVERKIDDMLVDWLGELRASHHVRVYQD